ncbi:glycoside hydrolase family 88 protein [Caulobacter segnis]
MPEFIELLDLKPGDGLRAFLIDALEAQIKALTQFQDAESGLWHTIINDKTSYLEASATAGFAYGILKAVRKRYIGKEYEAVAIRAIKGVLANIDDKGELQQVSFGTRCSTRSRATRTSADLDAVRPVAGHAGLGRVPAGLHLTPTPHHPGPARRWTGKGRQDPISKERQAHGHRRHPQTHLGELLGLGLRRHAGGRPRR